MTPNPDISWWNPTLWPNDPLYKEITNGTSGLQFFLGHHTFSHENLNNVTYNDAYLQLRLNQVRVLPFAHVVVLFPCCGFAVQPAVQPPMWSRRARVLDTSLPILTPISWR